MLQQFQMGGGVGSDWIRGGVRLEEYSAIREGTNMEDYCYKQILINQTYILLLAIALSYNCVSFLSQFYSIMKYSVV